MNLWVFSDLAVLYQNGSNIVLCVCVCVFAYESVFVIWDFCGFQVLYGYMCMLVFYDTVQPCRVILRKISLSIS